MTAMEIREAITQIRQLTNKNFAVNLFIPEKHHATDEQIEQAKKIIQESCDELTFELSSIKPPYAPPFAEQMNVILEEKIPIFSFTFGIPPQEWIEKFKKNGVILIGTATKLEEAKLLAEYEMDAIVAQGSEAGGHRGTFLGAAEDANTSISVLLPLLTESLKVPIIAAGGIMNAKGILNSLMLGASAVQMGTAEAPSINE